MWVCSCNGVRSEDVLSLVDAGVTDTAGIAAACGAGGDCGRCRPTVERLIRDAGHGRDLVSSGVFVQRP